MNTTQARGCSCKQPQHVHTPTSARLLQHCGHSGRPRPTVAGALPFSGSQHSGPQRQVSIPKRSLSEASTGLPLPRWILRPSREQRDGSDREDTRAPPLPGHVAPGKKEAQPLWAPTCSSVNAGDDWACPPKGWAVGSAYPNHQENPSSDTFSVLCPLLHEIPVQTRTVFLWTPSPLGSLRKGHRTKGRAGQPCVPTAGTLKARGCCPLPGVAGTGSLSVSSEQPRDRRCGAEPREAGGRGGGVGRAPRTAAMCPSQEGGHWRRGPWHRLPAPAGHVHSTVKETEARTGGD